MYTIGNCSIFLTGAAYFALCSIFAVPVAGFPQMPFDAGAYYNRGKAYYLKRDYENAITDFGLAIKLKRDFAIAYKKRVGDFDPTIKLRPEDADLYYNRGRAYHNLGKPDRAIADYTQAINIKTSHAAAYYTRGVAYFDKWDKAKATFDFLKVIELTNDPILRQKTRAQLRALGMN